MELLCISNNWEQVFFFPWNKGCTRPFLSHFKWLLGRLRATYAFFKLAKKEILLVKICYKTEKRVCPGGFSEWRAMIIWTQNSSASEINTAVIHRNLFKGHIKATSVKQLNWLRRYSSQKGNLSKSLHFYYFSSIKQLWWILMPIHGKAAPGNPTCC